MSKYSYLISIIVVLVTLAIVQSSFVPSAFAQGEPAPTPRPIRLSSAALNKFCSSNTAIVNAPAYTDAPGLHPAIILKEAGGVHPFNSAKELKALVSRTPQLAYCLSEPVKQQANNCYYLRKENDGWIEPIYEEKVGEFPTITVRVLVVQTGQVIDTFKLDGSYSSFDPYFCDVKNGKLPQASPVTAAQLAEHIKPFVNRQ